MDESTRLSLLQYSRSRGVSVDYRSVDPLNLAMPLLSQDTSSPPVSLDNNPICVAEWQSALQTKINNEKLEVSKDCVRFLSSVFKHSQSGKIIDVNPDTSLCKSGRVERLRISSTPFKSGLHSGLLTYWKTECLKSIASSLAARNEGYDGDEGLKFPDYFHDLAEEVREELRGEKLSCSTDTLRCLQRIRTESAGSLDWKTNVLTRDPINIDLASVSTKFHQPTPPSRSTLLASPHLLEKSSVMSGVSSSTGHITPSPAPNSSHIKDDSCRLSPQSLTDDIAQVKHQTVDPDSHNHHSSLALPPLPAANPQSENMVESYVVRNDKSHSLASLSNKVDSNTGCKTVPDLNEIATHVIPLILQDQELELTPFKSGGRNSHSTSSTFGCKVSTIGASHRDEHLNVPSDTQCIQSSFGSILSFMETRGERAKRRKLESSPYFEEKLNVSKLELPATSNHPATPPVSSTEDFSILRVPGLTPKRRAKRERTGKPLTVILSTGLLESDREIVRELEQLPPDSSLIYRDYGSRKTGQSRSQNILDDNPADADIIVSPSTGVLLTTFQETSQKYLPGHKPKDHGMGMIGPLCCSSPLQERIYSLCTRYDRLYVLIRLPAEQQPKEDGLGANSVTVDIKNITSISSLSAFCHSLYQHSFVIPFLVPCSPSSVIDVVCSMAEKHLDNSSRASAPPLPQNSDARPIRLEASHTDILPESCTILIHEVTQSELFLRQVGLNPFAAQTVLGVMEKGHVQQVPPQSLLVAKGGSVNGASSSVPREGVKPDYPQQTNSVQGLSAFIEMSSAERASLFDSVIGERVLRRVNRRLEIQWLLQ